MVVMTAISFGAETAVVVEGITATIGAPITAENASGSDIQVFQKVDSFAGL